MADLLQTQQKLQQEAREVIDKLDLRNISKAYGEMRIVGSLKYGLMTWRDIDIDLVLENEPSDEIYWEIVKSIFSKGGVKNLTLADNRKSDEKDRPKSMYIGVKYQDNQNNIWKIDIRLLSKDSVTADKTALLIQEKLTEDSKKTILEIKSQVHNNPNYHKGFSSTDIYEAVLIHRVKNLNEFKNYLKKIGKSSKFVY